MESVPGDKDRGKQSEEEELQLQHEHLESPAQSSPACRGVIERGEAQRNIASSLSSDSASPSPKKTKKLRMRHERLREAQECLKRAREVQEKRETWFRELGGISNDSEDGIRRFGGSDYPTHEQGPESPSCNPMLLSVGLMICFLLAAIVLQNSVGTEFLTRERSECNRRVQQAETLCMQQVRDEFGRDLLQRAIAEERKRGDLEAKSKILSEVSKALNKAELMCNSRLAKCSAEPTPGEASQPSPVVVPDARSAAEAEFKAQNLWERERHQLRVKVAKLEEMLEQAQTCSGSA